MSTTNAIDIRKLLFVQDSQDNANISRIINKSISKGWWYITAYITKNDEISQLLSKIIYN